MKLPHSQAIRSGRTPWSVSLLCATLLSIPAHAIEVRIDPPPSPEKTLRGLGALFHRTVKQPRAAADRARSNLVQTPEAVSSTRSASRTPDLASRSRRIASYRQQDAVTLDEAKPAPQRSKKVDRPKSSTPADGDEPAAPPASESETGGVSSPGTQPQVSSSSPATPPPAQAVAFARPVPGKKGIVYPPGVGESPDTEVDVSELQPGELARDPRSGILFRVP